jgi:hypothetical protein
MNLRLRKKVKLYYKLHSVHLRDNFIFLISMSSIFLPVRFFYWTYVSHTWHTNLGLMTGIVIVLFFLVRKKKLGWFGDLYHRQMIRVAANRKIGIALLLSTIINTTLFWGILYYYDYGESHKDDILLYNALLNPYGLKPTRSDISFNGTAFNIGQDVKLFYSPYYLQEYVRDIQPDLKVHLFYIHITDFQFMAGWLDYSLNTTLTNSWGTHFAAVAFIGEIEGMGLWYFYRRVYMIKIGYSWEELKMFDKQIKKYVKISKKIKHY